MGGERMATPLKFTFDTVFDVGDGGFGDGQPTYEAYSDKEIEAIRAEARREGAEEATARERASTARHQAEALEAIAARLATIAETQGAALGRAAEDAVALTLDIARKIAPGLLRGAPLAEVEAMIREWLPQLMDEPRVVVRVDQSLLDGLRDHIDDLVAASGFAGRVVLLADAETSGADCRMEWADGGVERDTESVWRDIDACIDRLLPVRVEAMAGSVDNAPPTEPGTTGEPAPD